jgi:hypothetical protein
MSDSRHCPFLNRADERCASYFSIDGLGHAYRYCFDRYKTCPVYIQLLIERRVKRADAAAAEKSREHTPTQASLAVTTAPLVQVTLPPGPRINPAGAPGLPASPRV